MKKLNQRGEFAIVAIIALAIIVWGVIVIYHSYQYKEVYQKWTQACFNLSGNVQESGAGLSDCFIDDKPCQVSGFQQYETNNPNPRFDNLPICEPKSDAN